MARAIRSMLWVAAGAAAFGCLWAQSPAPRFSQELTWPQGFDVQGPQVQSLGFAVTQAGQVAVRVQAQGAPITVAIRGPLPNPLPQPPPQSVPGGLQFAYNLRPQDLQRGIFWQIDVRLAPGAALQPGARSTGVIDLQRPPVNAAMVQRAGQAMQSQMRAPTAQQSAQAAAQMTQQLAADFNARKAQLTQHLAQRRAAVMAQVQPALDALRRQKAAAARPSTPQAAGQLQSRAIMPILRVGPAAPPTIAAVTIANNQDVLNLRPGSYGQPGDMVTLDGTAFGSVDGEIHFVLGPTPAQDFIAPAASAVWTDTRIMVPVPPISALPAYAGAVYVKRHSDGAKSGPYGLSFQPDIVQREIRVLSDLILQQANSVNVILYSGDVIVRTNNNFFSGVTGTDRFFVNTRLKNGWTVAAPAIAATPPQGYTGGSSVALSMSVGTSNPATNVLFSVNPQISGNYQYTYAVTIPIQGPSGLPDGIECTSPASAYAPDSECNEGAP